MCIAKSTILLEMQQHKPVQTVTINAHSGVKSGEEAVTAVRTTALRMGVANPECNASQHEYDDYRADIIFICASSRYVESSSRYVDSSSRYVDSSSRYVDSAS